MYFFSRKLFFFDHHAIQGENPKVSNRGASVVLLLSSRDPGDHYYAVLRCTETGTVRFTLSPLSTSSFMVLDHRGVMHSFEFGTHYLTHDAIKDVPCVQGDQSVHQWLVLPRLGVVGTHIVRASTDASTSTFKQKASDGEFLVCGIVYGKAFALPTLFF